MPGTAAAAEILANYSFMVGIRNKALVKGTKISVFGHELRPKYNSCQKGFIQMEMSAVNSGIILIPDEIAEDSSVYLQGLVANYRKNDKKEAEISLGIIDLRENNPEDLPPDCFSAQFFIFV